MPTLTATPGPTASAAPLQLQQLGTFASPVWVGPVPGDAAHLWLVERVGRVVEITSGGVKTGVVLDLTKLVSKGNEQGLLSLAFDPGFTTNHHFYVDYTDVDGNTRVVRYTWKDRQPVERTPLLEEDQPYPNHNGGLLLFDKTGALLVGLGDGGSAGDPENRAQNLGSDLGKILRISPDPTVRFLKDNPFPTNKRVWALGLRNPWRFSFDTDGTLYVGDVGQDKVEEVDVVAPALQRGANYGWSVYEGDEVYKQDQIVTGGHLVKPALTYLHSSGGCSVTGGIVYRGAALPSLVGTYVFGDYCAGKLMGSRKTAEGMTDPVQLGVRVGGLQAFGVDRDGELLVLSSDTLYRLIAG
ncbi:MAG: hypothetical protein JWO22_3380 [Frankiales bacterium]|nr:hypothetical protein [Frankiales bacterium]